jgi:hypothetical protein
MDDATAWQAIDHAYAVAIWILRYIAKNNLPVAEDETFPSFKHNLLRLNAILRTLNYPLPRNPILSEDQQPPDKLPVYL